jgi:hypothetical protein
MPIIAVEKATLDALIAEVNGLAAAQARTSSAFKRIFEPNNSKAQINAAIKETNESLFNGIGSVTKKLSDTLKGLSTAPLKQSGASEIRGLVKFADYLDSIGAYALADKVTEVAVIVKMAEEEMVQRPIEKSLSTRYCPDHCGVTTSRVGEGSYQCPLDGKIYNYQAGYVNYKGQQVPGGSVSEQTSSTSDCGGIPLRIFDGTQNIINTIN